MIQINRQSEIIFDSLQNFIDYTAITTSPLFELSDELKYIPIVTNITYFEELASINIKPNFTIVDPIFSDSGTTFVPVPKNREYYCPLSYLSPNTSISLYKFVGVDVCNRTSWKSLISQMINTNFTFVVEPRIVIPTNTFTLDIGKRIDDDLTGELIGFTVHSFFIDEFSYRTLNDIYPKYTNYSVAIKIEEFDKVLFKHINYDEIGGNDESSISVNISAQILNITFRYSNEYYDSFSSSNNVITLIIILLLFLIVDVIILLFYILYNRKQDKEFYSKLERQNSYVAKMINYVNHEIRNPLNSIIGMVDLTRMDIYELNIEDKSVLISNLDTVYNSGLLIQHIVNDVLDIRKLEQGKLQLTYKYISLQKFSKELLKLLTPKIQEYPHINFSIHCNVSNMSVDPIRLNQILLNLVSNSFKFTNEGFIRLSIDIYNDGVNGDEVLFQVIDTGCGVPIESQNLLFQPFEQVNTNSVSRQVGYGLGLYLCKMLVTLMNGNIGMKQYKDDQSNELGSIFWFKIPKKECDTKIFIDEEEIDEEIEEIANDKIDDVNDKIDEEIVDKIDEEIINEKNDDSPITNF